MSVFKLTITTTLKLIISIILIFGLVNLVLLYQFGIDSNFPIGKGIKNLEFPLSMLQTLNSFDTLHKKEYGSNSDSLNMNIFITRFSNFLESLQSNLVVLDSLATDPEEVKQVELLNASYIKYQTLYNTLSSDMDKGTTPSVKTVQQQFEKVGMNIEDTYQTSLNIVLAHLYQNGLQKKSIITIIFIITGLSLLLMISSGFYSTRIIKQSEKKLAQAYENRDREKRQFIRYLSHELNTTVSTINLSTRLLSDKRSGRLNKNQKELIGTIENQSKRLLKMVKETRQHSIQNSKNSESKKG
jgi:signal transduction histidine kinase